MWGGSNNARPTTFRNRVGLTLLDPPYEFTSSAESRIPKVLRIAHQCAQATGDGKIRGPTFHLDPDSACDLHSN